jgi:hypothetical protein
MTNTKSQTTLQKIKALVFPERCPTCGWNAKRAKEMHIMFETLMEIEGIFALKFMPMNETHPPEMIDINQQARERIRQVQEALRKWHEREAANV